MEYDIKKLGRIIRKERKRLGLTQNKLGEKLGICGKQVSNYENGVLIPPQDALFKMAEIFHCEFGYLLGEKSYGNHSKLNTAICTSLGLTENAVESIRRATHNCLQEDLEERQHYICTFFESPYFGDFLDRFVDAATASYRLKEYASSVEQELVAQYGEKAAMKAVLSFISSEIISDDCRDDDKACEAKKEFDASIDKMQNDEYALKVARYELREAFEQLVRNIF